MPTKIEKDALTGQETTGHEWDGVRELNNPLPRWWLYSFYATILFAVVYALLYPALPGLDGLLHWSTRTDLTRSLAEAAQAQAGWRDRLQAASLEEIRRDPELLGFAMAGGRAAFAENCAACHKAGGAGQRAYPSLADDDWLWGGSLADIHRTIQHGIRTAGAEARQSQMPRFGTDAMLTAREIDQVADHVLSLSGKGGSSPAGARLFEDNCAACHGRGGEGNRELGAPRLSDQIWLYGTDRRSLVQSIAQGRAGAMPAWADRLDPVTLKMLTLYVHGLGGGE